MKYFTAFLLALTMCGCSHQNHLSQMLATADHIVATNRYQAFGCIVTGADVTNLAHAVAAAKRPHDLTESDFKNPFDWDLEFYAGTNSLAVMHLLNHGVFKMEDIQYVDGSGVEEALWNKLDAAMRKR